jgi:FkbM family methyltransferase
MASSLRNLLKSVIPPVITNLARAWRDRRVRFYGLDSLDENLSRYLPYDNGYFVELGANDGISQSNTLHFERYKNWKGILVEPIPHNYLRCLANRSTDTRIFCNACTSFDYQERFVEIAYSDLCSCPMNLESDVGDPLAHASQGRWLLEKTEKIFTFGAVATSLNALLVQAHAPSTIDLLSLDVEGAEIEVLKGIDHQRFRFKYLCIESRNIEKLAHYLVSVGYVLEEKLSGRDYLFASQASIRRTDHLESGRQSVQHGA